MKTSEIVLAGDVGGTKTRLARATVEDGLAVRLDDVAVYPSAEHESLGALVREYLSSRGFQPRRAAVGVAGPVVDGRCVATNIPWVVDEREVRAASGAEAAFLLNDLEIMANGIAALSDRDFVTLSEGRPDPRGNAALLAAGTGLGEALLFFDGTRLVPSACEGGHTDFGPRTQDEAELLAWLRARHGHVSYERIVSGPGLESVYEFFSERDRQDGSAGSEPAALAVARREKRLSAAVSEHALRGLDPVAAAALDLFVSVYGAEASNLALKGMATGGVFVGGGIAPKILPKLRDGAFMRAFRDKGRLAPVVEAMPVRVIVNESTPLLGAARYAVSGRLR